MTLEIVLTCVYDKLHVSFIKSHVFHNFIEETVLCGFCNIVKFKVKTFFLVCLSLRHAIFLGLSYQLASIGVTKGIMSSSRGSNCVHFTHNFSAEDLS